MTREVVVKEFVTRLLYYFLIFGLSIVGMSIVFPPIISVIAWPYTRRWSGFEELLDDGITILCRGLVLSLVISFVITLAEYGRSRGWSDARTLTFIALTVVVVVGLAEYVRSLGWW